VRAVDTRGARISVPIGRVDSVLSESWAKGGRDVKDYGGGTAPVPGAFVD